MNGNLLFSNIRREIFFQSPLMFNVYAGVPDYKPGVIGVVDNCQKLAGVLLYNIISAKGVRSKFSSRSIITGGPLVNNNDPELISILLKEYHKVIAKEKVIYSQVRNINNFRILSNVFQLHHFTYQDHLAIHIDLTKEEERLVSEMHKKRYSNIKRVLKKNISVKQLQYEEALEDIITLMDRTYKRINVPGPPAALFYNAFHRLKNNVLILGAYTGSTLIGVACICCIKI